MLSVILACRTRGMFYPSFIKCKSTAKTSPHLCCPLYRGEQRFHQVRTRGKTKEHITCALLSKRKQSHHLATHFQQFLLGVGQVSRPTFKPTLLYRGASRSNIRAGLGAIYTTFDLQRSKRELLNGHQKR